MTSPQTMTDPAQPAQTPAPADAAPTSSAQAGKPAATADQVAQVVEQEFPKYDTSGKGELTQADFGTWMVALRSASEPDVTAESAEMKSWVGQAFAQADTDRSRSVSKAELTSFLTAAS